MLELDSEFCLKLPFFLPNISWPSDFILQKQSLDLTSWPSGSCMRQAFLLQPSTSQLRFDFTHTRGAGETWGGAKTLSWDLGSWSLSWPILGSHRIFKTQM